jgi:hypothetical protein
MGAKGQHDPQIAIDAPISERMGFGLEEVPLLDCAGKRLCADPCDVIQPSEGPDG